MACLSIKEKHSSLDHPRQETVEVPTLSQVKFPESHLYPTPQKGKKYLTSGSCTAGKLRLSFPIYIQTFNPPRTTQLEGQHLFLIGAKRSRLFYYSKGPH